MVDFGHPKVNAGLPVINYSMAYDKCNRVPLFYEYYPGSIVDVSQLQVILDKAHAYGYRHVGFILDRGYFSKGNIQFMDTKGYDFVLMVKGKKDLVRKMVCSTRGTFENRRHCAIRAYRAYGTTVRSKLYEDDSKERYFHLIYSDKKRYAEREAIGSKIERMATALKKLENTKATLPDAYAKYFKPIYDDKGTLLFCSERAETIEDEIDLCGYYVIVTSERMTAREALELYKSRDTSEKLFRGDKSYLGNKSLRVMADDSASAKIFVEFVEMIARCRIYTLLKDEMLRSGSKANYMTVPAALRELEKIEMVRMPNGRYYLGHAITATQKAILCAFQMDSEYITHQANMVADALEC